MKKKRLTLTIVLLLCTLWAGVVLPAAAAEPTHAGISDGERIRLFVASQAMAAAKNEIPRWRAGTVVTDMGSADQVNTGAKIEYTIDDTHYFRVVLEGIYLEHDDGFEIATLASAKAIGVETRFGAPYVGAGIGITGPYKYQGFVGTEFSNGFFAEVKYMNEAWTISDGNLFFAVGFLLRF